MRGRFRSRSSVVVLVGWRGCSRLAGSRLALGDSHVCDTDFGCSRESHFDPASNAGPSARSRIGVSLAMMMIVIAMIASRGEREVALAGSENGAASRMNSIGRSCFLLLSTMHSLISRMWMVVIGWAAWGV